VSNGKHYYETSIGGIGITDVRQSLEDTINYVLWLQDLRSNGTTLKMYLSLYYSHVWIR